MLAMFTRRGAANPIVISQHRFNLHPRKILARGIGRVLHRLRPHSDVDDDASEVGRLERADPVPRLSCNSTTSLSSLSRWHLRVRRRAGAGRTPRLRSTGDMGPPPNDRTALVVGQIIGVFDDGAAATSAPG
jgi:hypothetical protein